MPDLKKYLKKLDVEPYYAVMGSIKSKAKHFLSVQRTFSRHNHLLVLTPEQVRVYELGLFYSASLREKMSLAGIQAIRVERNELFKNRTVFFENDKTIYRVRGLDDHQVDEFVKALVNITHVLPEGDYRNTKRPILSDSLIKSHGMTPTSVLSSVTGEQAHILLTARELIVLLHDGRMKKLQLTENGGLELHQGTYQLELRAFKPGAGKTQRDLLPDYVFPFSPDSESRLRTFCDEVNRTSQQFNPQQQPHQAQSSHTSTVYPSSPSPPNSQGPSQASAQNASEADIPAKIKQLAELRDLGILTDAEFETKKKDLLSRM